MLSERTGRQVAELRELLAHGGLLGLPRVTIGATVTVDPDGAVRAILADLDNPARAGISGSPQGGCAEEAFEAIYHAVRGIPAG